LNLKRRSSHRNHKGYQDDNKKENTPLIEESLKGYITKKMFPHILKENPNKMT
jgi:hypothetical protein